MVNAAPRARLELGLTAPAPRASGGAGPAQLRSWVRINVHGAGAVREEPCTRGAAMPGPRRGNSALALSLQCGSCWRSPCTEQCSSS